MAEIKLYTRKLLYNKKITTIDYTIYRFVDTIDRCFSYSPLPNRDTQSLFTVRSA